MDQAICGLHSFVCVYVCVRMHSHRRNWVRQLGAHGIVPAWWYQGPDIWLCGVLGSCGWEMEFKF